MARAWMPRFARRPALTVLLVLLAMGLPLPAAAQPVEPRDMSRLEIQLIQQALVWEGDYNGLLDGGWGRNTAEAARNWRRRNGLPPGEAWNPAEVERLLRAGQQRRTMFGWEEMRDRNTRLWIGYPGAILRPDKTESIPGMQSTMFRASGNLGLVLQTLIMGLGDVRALLAGNVRPGDVVTYRLDRADRQVLVVETTSGRTVYQRFDRAGAEWRGFMLGVRSTDPDAARLITAISSSLSAGDAPVLPSTATADALPNLGPVVMAARIMPVLGQPAPALPAPIAPRPDEAARPQPTPAPAAGPGRIAGSGTGFVVDADGLLMTNQHVVRGCRSVELTDGTAAQVVRADATRDLALLRVDRRFAGALAFRRDLTVDLGEAVSAAGFPLFRTVSTSLNLTNGIVTALRGVRDDPLHFQINAAIQPGNSGGPVFDNQGLVIGVAVARLDDETMMSRTGSVPQTMNYAIRGAVAVAFLLEAGTLATQRAEPVGDLREVGRQAQALVLPVLCRR